MSNWLTCVYEMYRMASTIAARWSSGQQRRMLRPDVGVRRHVAQQRHVEALGRGAEIFDVAAVQRIERAVDHRHRAAVRRQLVERQNHEEEAPTGSMAGRNSGSARRGVLFASTNTRNLSSIVPAWR